MNDPRISRLAELLLDHSCRMEKGQKVLIEAFDLPDPTLVCRLIEKAAERGVTPLADMKNNQVLRALYRTGSEESIGLAGQVERTRMEQVDAYIGIRGAANSSELADVPAEKMDLYARLWWKTVHTEIRIRKTKWVVLRYPTPSMAQSARMSSEAFEDFYFDVCTADYAQMARDQTPLQRRMEAADHVRIKSPGTDLSFSIKGISVVPCNGQCNIPDGEVFTAPVKDSVNGVISFNTKTLYQGTVFEGVRLEFENGKIVKSWCQNEPERLEKILRSDEGASYIGEWSIGCNNRIKHPMLDTLFDEKIGGSFHLTPGNAYDEADNGNRSQVHWDMVLIQTPEYGGGEIWFDGELLRKDGKFVPADLAPLNQGL
ncbi:aminopeptidase [bacterium]|jgi:aminopeptidase|nr:aminopeptidase [bacterium]